MKKNPGRKERRRTARQNRKAEGKKKARINNWNKKIEARRKARGKGIKPEPSQV